MIFFAKILFSAIRHQKTYFLSSLEENEDADIKYPINLKHSKNTSIDEQAEQANFLCDLKMSLLIT